MKTEISVLYVDDEEINQFIFKKTFDKSYLVSTAGSGKEALQLLKSIEGNIDVVISDMRMPAMNGVEFIKEAKNSYERPIYYILTGFEYNQDIEYALETNLIKGYLKKPFNADEIKMKISSELVN